MIYIRQNTPFVLVWEIELQGTAIKLADTKVSVIASCARGRIDLTDYIYSIEENTITIEQNKGLAFIGDYSLMAIIESENLTTLKVQEKYVFRTIAKNDPTETESLVSIRSSIVASGGYDSALSEVSQNAIQNAPVAKEFGKVYQAIEDTESLIKQSVEDVLGGASEAYDTLKEIEDYIEKDEAGAVALTQSIARLETEKVSKEDIDSALSTESENPVMNMVVTAELGKKADTDGVYSDLTAGDLAGRGESVPAEFGFRASGGKSIKDGRAYIKRIKGNSVVWNQLRGSAIRQSMESSKGGISIQYNKGETLQNVTGTYEGFEGDFNWYNAGGFNAIKGVIGHKYLCSIRGNKNALMTVYGHGGPSVVRIKDSVIITAATATNINIIPCLDTNMAIGTVVNESIFFLCTDLTKMFGAGNEPTTIEDFNARVATLGVDMNAYNEGEVIHCNTESIKSVGDNAWDEEWRNGHYGSSTGIYNSSSQSVCNANPIRVLPNQEYYNTKAANGYVESYAFFYDVDMNFISYASMARGAFTTPANSVYMNFYFVESAYGTTYNHDIMITLVHSGWKQDTDAGYQPYWQDTLPLPIIRKYFPDGMKSAGTAYDEIYYDKMQNKKFAVQRMKAVKMKDLYWSLYTASNNNTSFMASLQGIRQPSTNAERIDGALIAKYSPTTGNQNTGSLVDKCWVRVTNNIYIKDDAFASAEAFVNSLNDNDVIYYELAEPIVTELDAEDQNFRDYYNVADFGTEMSQSSVPSAPFSADIIYQFNAVDMIREHELEITELQNVIATMQAQLTSLINGGQ